MGTLIHLVVGGLIGALASMITKNDLPLGWIGNIIGGFLGAWLGGMIFGEMGPVVGGFYILPAFIGAMLFVAITSMLLRGK